MSQNTILVVDDHPEIGKGLCAVLRARGYKTTLVESGSAALDFVSQHKVDVIVLDLHMPHMDGWEVLQSLRAQSRHDHVKVVVCSAGAGDVRTLVAQRGGQGLIHKDAAYAQLDRAIETVLKGCVWFGGSDGDGRGTIAANLDEC